MMKSKQHIFVCLILASFTLCSCGKDPVKEEPLHSPDEPALSSAKAPKSTTLAWYPSDSKVEVTQSSIQVDAPEGWAYAGYDANGKLLIAGEEVQTKISCTCNASGTCSPFKATGPGGTFSGCGGDCTNCTMLQSAFTRYQESNVYSGGYFNPSLKPRLLKNGEVIPAVFDALFEVKEFQQQLSGLYKEAYKGRPFVKARYANGTAEAPKGYSLVGVSIMGRGLLVVLPSDYIRGKLGYDISLKATCGCSEGSCSLKDKAVLGVGAIWCSGFCTGTCTLNTSFAGVPQYSVVLSSFRF